MAALLMHKLDNAKFPVARQGDNKLGSADWLPVYMIDSLHKVTRPSAFLSGASRLHEHFTLRVTQRELDRCAAARSGQSNQSR